MKVRLYILFIFWALVVGSTNAQNLIGRIIDAATGQPVPYATLSYQGHKLNTVADGTGRYSIARHNGWSLQVTALGYKAEMVAVETASPRNLDIRLQPNEKTLNEVVVRSKKSRYSRKNNPAVELMRRVIAAKKQTRLENNDFYQFNKYQKITLARNNVTNEELAKLREKGSRDWIADQVEECELNGKNILPVQVSETVTQKVYRKQPHDEKQIIIGETNQGVANLIESAGIFLDAGIKDIFTDVDIYDDQVRLLKYYFTSPIGKDAIAFYRFYIADTLDVSGDECIRVSFTPNNQQDFGFNGDIYILNDSTLHVKRVELSIPRKSDVNFVEGMKINQEYRRMDDGQWVLDSDNMLVEMRLNKMIKNGVVVRTTKYSDYSFKPIPKSMFRGSATVVTDADSKLRGNDFWNRFRTVQLTKSEKQMNSFVKRISNIKGMKYLLFVGRAFMNNYIGTSLSDTIPSKFDFGPVNTIVGNTLVDGFRMRLSGRTMAALNPHLFWEGYVAHGFKSNKWYYSTLFTYSFNRKNNSPWEFPIREVSVLSENDIMSPSDKFLSTNKDNIFTSIRVGKSDKFYFYNRQRLQFRYETLAGLGTTFGIKTEAVKGAAAMTFYNVDGTPYDGEIRTTELSLSLRYAPGEMYLNTKQRRYPINHEAPVFAFSHTMGVNGLLGGKYAMNYSEVSISKRFWLHSWGKLDVFVKGGAQWNKVPFPLLIMPPTNLSYLSQRSTHTFQLMNNMEFLNDRIAQMNVSWDLTGKLFNRIPLLRHMKWREYIGFRAMYGKLTDKNNPLLPQNATDRTLMQFPEGCHTMDHRPYMEMVFGVHNIFKFLEIDYVRRLSYTELDTAIKDGVRIGINLTF